jgi:8-oxo-dGTP diphosphatase
MERERGARPVLCVGGVIVDGDRVVLIRRGKAPDAGDWSIPGGAVEAGESLAEALRREVREETGLEVRVGGLLEIYERVDRDAAGAIVFHYVVIDYRCEPIGGALRAGDDAADAVWADVAGLDPYALNPDARRVISSATRDRPAGPAAR